MTALRLVPGVVDGGVVATWVLDDRLRRVDTALLREDESVHLRLTTGHYFACLQLPDGKELIEPFTVEDSTETVDIGLETTSNPSDGVLDPRRSGDLQPAPPVAAPTSAALPRIGMWAIQRLPRPLEQAWQRAGPRGRRPVLFVTQWQLDADGWSTVQHRETWRDWHLGVPIEAAGDPAKARAVVLASSFLPSRVVLSPPGPAVRIHARPGISEGNLQGWVSMSVTTGDAELDTLIGHLGAGRMRAAAVAARALLDGPIDPKVSITRATVAAYYELWYGDPAAAIWTGELLQTAPDLPDAAIVHAWRLHYENPEDAFTPILLLAWAAGVGPPVFSLGLRRLIDGLLLQLQNERLGHEDKALARQALAVAERFGVSASTSAISTSYHGWAPDRPAMRSAPRHEYRMEADLAGLRAQVVARANVATAAADVVVTAILRAGKPTRSVEAAPRKRTAQGVAKGAAAVAAGAGAVAAAEAAARRRGRTTTAAGKLGVAVGAAVGYVLGAKAGRERYEQITASARQLLDKPKVKRVIDSAPGNLGARVEQVAKAADKVQQARDKVAASRGSTTGDPSGGTPETGTGTPSTPATERPSATTTTLRSPSISTTRTMAPSVTSGPTSTGPPKERSTGTGETTGGFGATRRRLMASRLNPYISFDSNARQAMEFYKGVFGGNLTMNTFGEYGFQDSPDADKVMHGQLETDSGFTLMAADTPAGMQRTPGDNIAISLSGDDAGELRGYWEKLSDGGNVTMPLEKQMWGDEFGMCVDRFGVPWLVNITQPQA